MLDLSSPLSSLVLYLFFFQAEDGIRDTSVTGVQACALPICCPYPTLGEVERFREIAVQTVTVVKDAQKTAVWREREQALAAYRKGEEDYALVMDAPAKLVKALEAM